MTTTPMTETLTEIARTLGFTTLATQNSDSLDFRDVAVWSVERALRAAYEAGMKAAQPAAPIDRATVVANRRAARRV